MTSALLLCAVALLQSQTAPNSDLDKLKKSMEAAESKLVRTERTVTMLDGKDRMFYREAKDGSRFRFEFTAPDTRYEALSNGTDAYWIRHDDKRYLQMEPSEVERQLSARTTEGSIDFRAIIDLMMDSVKAMRQFGEGTLKGEPAIRYQLAGLLGSDHTAELWVAKKDSLFLSLEVTFENNQKIRIESRRDPQFPAGYFDLQPDKLSGYDLVRLEPQADVRHVHATGIEIIAETDEDLTKGAWTDMVLRVKITPIEEADFKQVVQSLTEAMALYPPELLTDLIERVVVVEEFELDGRGYGGTYTDGTLYITSGSPQWIRQTFHHEFSSVILDAHADLFPKEDWTAINGMDYISLDQWYDGDDVDWHEQSIELWDAGFLSRYSTTDMENDFNEIFEALLDSSPVLFRAASRHERLAKKIALVKAFLGSVDPYFSADYFAGLDARVPGRWTSETELPRLTHTPGENHRMVLPITRGDASGTINLIYAEQATSKPTIILLAEDPSAASVTALVEEWAARDYPVAIAGPDWPAALKGEQAEVIYETITSAPVKWVNRDEIIVVGIGSMAMQAERLTHTDRGTALKVKGLILIEPTTTYGLIDAERFLMPTLVVDGAKSPEDKFSVAMLPQWVTVGKGQRVGVWTAEPYPGLANPEALKLVTAATVAFLGEIVEKESKAATFLRKTLPSGPLRPFIFESSGS